MRTYSSCGEALPHPVFVCVGVGVRGTAWELVSVTGGKCLLLISVGCLAAQGSPAALPTSAAPLQPASCEMGEDEDG